MALPIVLTIDDDKTTHRFVAKALSKDFQLVDAFNGLDGIELANSSHPDVILLDVEMPGMNGYEVCDKLKHNKITHNIPVVFLSASSSLEERMHGYEVGATDYMVKPFESESLRAKAKVLIDLYANQKGLSEQVEAAERTAKIAMSSNADLGLVLQFVENCFQIEDANRLAKSILSMTHSMQLNIILQITFDDEPLWFSSNDRITPLEKEVMTMLKDKRHNDFGTRTVVNFPNISLMVKNMPVEDPEHYGRIKDLIPAILSTANGKVDNLNNTLMVQRQTMDTIRTFEMMNDSLNGLFERNHQNRQKVEDVLREMFQELQKKVPHMGLDEDQEEYILDRVDSSIVKVTETNDQANDIFLSIKKVLADLDDLAANQRELSEWMSRTTSNIDNDDDESLSVHLF